MNSVLDAGRPPVTSAASLTPTELENLIEIYRTIGVLEPDRVYKQFAFNRMRLLINARSRDTIARMEAAQGLR